MKNRNDVIYKYKVDESVVNEASIKGKNNKTGEAFGMVIGSDKKNKQGEFEVTIRITYSSRISSYKFMFGLDDRTELGTEVLLNRFVMNKLNVMINPQQKYVITTPFTLDK